jgi:hypothetical protein
MFFPSGQSHFVSVNDDNEIASIDVWRENRLLFASQQVGGPYRDLAQHLVLRIDYPPFAWDFTGFGGKRFHYCGKGTKTTGRGRECQIFAQSVLVPNGDWSFSSRDVIKSQLAADAAALQL